MKIIKNSTRWEVTVIWAAKAAKMGFRWRVGNWMKIRFWED
jgi:hypothetical protein